MNKLLFKILWALMFAVTAALGFIPEPEGIVKILLVGLSLLFFLPPAMLLWLSWRQKDTRCLRGICRLAVLSLGVTLALMVANLLSVLASQAVGDFLYGCLVIFGAPLICGQYWFLGPALWAAVLFAGLELLKEAKK